MEDTQTPLVDPSVAALAAALRIFAARGRAIREERARRENSASDKPSGHETMDANSKPLPEPRNTIQADLELPGSE